MLDTPLLLKRRDNRRLAILAVPARITSMWGTGNLRYVTDDHWCGVQLDGERSVYEYPAQHITVVS